MLWSSEVADPGFFESIRAENPNGYVVGTGAAMTLALVTCFKKENPPKGIVIADIQPEVIAFGKLLVGSLAKAKTRNDFERDFLSISEEEYRSRVKNIIDKEKDKELKRRYKKRKPTFLYIDWHLGYYRHGPNYLVEKKVQLVDIIRIVLNNFDLFHNLAVNGNIAIAFVDFTDPRFINAIKDLPDFRSVKNLIYSSNIEQVSHFPDMSQLEAYTNTVLPPIFISTADRSKTLHLQTDPEVFKRKTAKAPGM